MENYIKELKEWIKQNTSFSEENGHSVPTIHLEKEIQRLEKKYFPVLIIGSGGEGAKYALEQIAASKAGLLPVVNHRFGGLDTIHISKATREEFYKSLSTPITVIDIRPNTYISTRNFSFLDNQLQCNMQIAEGTVFQRIVDDPTNFSDGCMIVEESVVLVSDNFKPYDDKDPNKSSWLKDEF